MAALRSQTAADRPATVDSPATKVFEEKELIGAAPQLISDDQVD